VRSAPAARGFTCHRELGEQPLACGLFASEYRALAAYNAEVARGLVHNDRWAADMAALQTRFTQGTTG
jgi:hypothetical protein